MTTKTIFKTIREDPERIITLSTSLHNTYVGMQIQIPRTDATMLVLLNAEEIRALADFAEENLKKT